MFSVPRLTWVVASTPQIDSPKSDRHTDSSEDGSADSTLSISSGEGGGPVARFSLSFFSLSFRLPSTTELRRRISVPSPRPRPMPSFLSPGRALPAPPLPLLAPLLAPLPALYLASRS